MTFFITPPVVVGRDFSVSAIQIGNMELPESLVVSMATWSAIDLLRHWRRELGALISGERLKACIVTGLLMVGERVVPTEWWPARFVEGKVVFHYQALSTVEPGIPWNSPDTWWTQVEPPDESVSQWSATLNDLAAWCDFADTVFRAAEVAAEDSLDDAQEH